MSAYRTLDEIYYGLRAARERFENSLDMATRDAAGLSVRMLSADQTVEVAIRGDCTLESVRIDEHAYAHHNADSLRASILGAYRAAVFELSRQQHMTILRTVVPVEQR